MAALGRDGAMTTSFLLSFTVLTISWTASPGVTPSGFWLYRTVGGQRSLSRASLMNLDVAAVQLH